MAPHLLEGGRRPEIEPGEGSPWRRQGRAWCWCGSEVAPDSSLQVSGEVGMCLSLVPAGAGAQAHPQWAASHQVLCAQACDTRPHSRHASHGHTHRPPALMEKHAHHKHTSVLGPDGWTHTRDHKCSPRLPQPHENTSLQHSCTHAHARTHTRRQVSDVSVGLRVTEAPASGEEQPLCPGDTCPGHLGTERPAPGSLSHSMPRSCGGALGLPGT